MVNIRHSVESLCWEIGWRFLTWEINLGPVANWLVGDTRDRMEGLLLAVHQFWFLLLFSLNWNNFERTAYTYSLLTPSCIFNSKYDILLKALVRLFFLQTIFLKKINDFNFQSMTGENFGKIKNLNLGNFWIEKQTKFGSGSNFYVWNARRTASFHAFLVGLVEMMQNIRISWPISIIIIVVIIIINYGHLGSLQCFLSCNRYTFLFLLELCSNIFPKLRTLQNRRSENCRYL